MPSNFEHVTTAVLLIDANKAARAFYANGLKRCTPGYLTIEADDAQTARQISGYLRVDCVVLELALPDESGFKLLQHFVPIPSMPDVPVIVLTTIEDLRVYAVAKQSGAYTCLDKAHTTPEDLDRAIQRVLVRAA